MFKREDLMGLKDAVEWPYLLNSLGFQKINVQSKRCCCLIHGGQNQNSFSWNNGYFHCFSCLCSGDSIELVMIVKRFNFVDSIKYLSDLFGYGIRTISNVKKKIKNEEQEIPQYIIDKLQNQNYETMQIDNILRNIELEIDEKTEVLITLRAERKLFPEIEKRIKNRLAKLDEHLRYWTFQKNKLLRQNINKKKHINSI